MPKFFTEKTAAEILDAGFDAVIDAIDSTNHTALLLAGCHRREIFTVTCGGAGGRRDPTRIRVRDLDTPRGRGLTALRKITDRVLSEDTACDSILYELTAG